MSSPFTVDKAELLLKVLDRYGVQVRQKLGWQPVRCINDSWHYKGDRNPSAAVNVPLGRYMCHACDLRGDGFQIMLDMEQMAAKDVLVALGMVAGEERKEETWIL